MRLLKSFDYMRESTCDLGLLSEIAVTLKGLRAYYYKFNGAQVDEAIARAYLHASKSFNGQRGELKPYLKSLAWDIMKQKDDDVPVEEIEEIAIDTIVSVESEALENLVFEDVNTLLVKEILLPFMEDFLKFGELMSTDNKNTIDFKTYFPQNFKMVCMSLMKKAGAIEFTKSIKYLYAKYRKDIKWFLEQGDFIVKGYCEADYALLDRQKTKRIFITDSRGKEIHRPDYYEGDLYIKGAIGDRPVTRIRYSDLLNQMEVMATSPISNELTVVIGKNKVVRTCGGSILHVNTKVETIYDLLLDELLTNILKASNSRLLAVGYDYVYLLHGKYSKNDKIVLRGIIGFGDIELEIEQVDIKRLDR